MTSSSTLERPGPESSDETPEVKAPPVIAGRSPFQLAIARFRRDKLSMIALVVVVIYVILAITAPILGLLGVLDASSTHSSGPGSLLNPDTTPKGSLGGISIHHLLGVEPGTGRDVLSRVYLGISLSLFISLSATIITIGFGTIMGIISGFSGGIVDAGIGRFIDLTLAFPSTLMLLALSNTVVASLRTVPGMPNPGGNFPVGLYIIIVLSLFSWPPIARVVRGQVLSLREREFIEAAKLFGASRRRVYFKEILPNLWAPLLVYFTLTMPAFISAEAALSFLGVGIQAPTATLGNVLNYSIGYSIADPVFFFVPAVLIALIVIAFNLFGDGLRDALDPKGNR